jgi:YD repeat-containing protein
VPEPARGIVQLLTCGFGIGGPVRQSDCSSLQDDGHNILKGAKDASGDAQRAGQVCALYPAGPAKSGEAWVSTTTSEYSVWGVPAKVVETGANGAARTVSTTFLADGAVGTVATATVGLANSAAIPVKKNVYDSATWLQTATVALVDGKETGRVSTGYDAWGRVASYTNSDGAKTTTEYDAAGRVSKTVSPKSTVTTTYDSSTERRGLPTSVAISGVGTFTAAYDAAANLVSQTMPGGLTQSNQYDETGHLKGLGYRTGDRTPSRCWAGTWPATRPGE